MAHALGWGGGGRGVHPLPTTPLRSSMPHAAAFIRWSIFARARERNRVLRSSGERPSWLLFQIGLWCPSQPLLFARIGATHHSHRPLLARAPRGPLLSSPPDLFSFIERGFGVRERDFWALSISTIESNIRLLSCGKMLPKNVSSFVSLLMLLWMALCSAVVDVRAMNPAMTKPANSGVGGSRGRRAGRGAAGLGPIEMSVQAKFHGLHEPWTVEATFGGPEDKTQAKIAAGGSGDALAQEMGLPGGPYNWLHCCPRFFGSLTNGQKTTVPFNLVLGTVASNNYMGVFEWALSQAINDCDSVARGDWSISAKPDRDGKRPYLAKSIDWSVSTPDRADCIQETFVTRRAPDDAAPKEQGKIYQDIINACCPAPAPALAPAAGPSLPSVPHSSAPPVVDPSLAPAPAARPSRPPLRRGQAPPVPEDSAAPSARPSRPPLQHSFAAAPPPPAGDDKDL